MKNKSFILLAALTISFGLTAWLTSGSSNKKVCCKKKIPCLPAQQNQPEPGGSSPDDLHYGTFNRLIVSTVK